MSDIKFIRESLGMSQELLASYLGIGRPTLALIETKKRKLPTAAMIKFGQLLQVVQNENVGPSAKSTAALQKQSQKYRTLINKHIQDCSLQAELLNFKLKEMKEQYKKNMKGLAVAAHVLSNLTNTAADKLDKETMQLLEIETLNKLQQCGLGAQAMLILKIKALNYQTDQGSKVVF